VERLRACLRERYDLIDMTLEFLPRGHDYRAGVYRAEGAQGAAYLLKVTSRPLYEPSCAVPRYLHERYLHDQELAAVVAPVPTTSGSLWAQLAEWTAILYPFLEGDTSLTGMTTEQWQEAGTIFRQIHQVRLPLGGFASLRKETFDPISYIRWIRAFETQHLYTRHGGSEPAGDLRAAWVAHQSTIHSALSSLGTLSAVLQARPLPHVICHADLHSANLLRDHAGHVYVVDWDEVMLAPKERDFIFIRDQQAEAFWGGYGQPEIDWVALTYFRWERVVQDLIEETEQVVFRNDVGEDAKAIAARRFRDTFAPNNSVDAAYAAATRLPSDLSLPKSDEW
jgi:spectinomycin phosphotransferase